MRPPDRLWRRLLQLGVALLLVLTGGLLRPAPAQAATLTVTTTADVFALDGLCSLREAIVAANLNVAIFPAGGECPAGSALTPDTIVLASGATYNLTNSVPDAWIGATGLPTVTGTLTIRGVGTTIRRNGGTFRILRVAPTAQLTLSGVTVRNGLAEVPNSLARGGGIYNEGTLNLLKGSTVRNNTITVNIVDTSATGYGGGIYNTGTVTLVNSSVINNSIAVTNAGTAASAYGGGIYNTETSTLTATTSTLDDNTVTASNTGTSARAYGGGLYSQGTVTLTTTTLRNNAITATNTGTGADAYGGGLAVVGSTLPGGANPTVTVTDSDIAGNQATVSITGTAGNASGGGIALLYGGTLTVARSVIRDNETTSNSYSDGSGIKAHGGTLSATNSTISGNTSTGTGTGVGSGGGLDLVSPTSATLTQVTIADNEATTGGGGLRHLGTGTLSLSGTIIAGNRTGGLTGHPTADCTMLATLVATGGSNLVGTGTGCPVLANHREVSAAGVFTTVLEPLALGGGPTYSHALKLAAGNPAVDAGDNTLCAAAPVSNLDQLGAARPFDGDGTGTAICDLGAVELRSALPALSLTTSTTVAPASVTVGGTAAITATVTSTLTQTFLVDVEIYDATNTKVYQQWFDSEPFTANVARQFVINWTVPAGTVPGSYTVKLGVFIPGWGLLYYWNDSAATITVT